MVFHMFPPKPICQWTHHFSGIESLDLALVCSVHILIFSRHLCSFVQMSFTVFPGSTTLLKSIQFINLIKFSLSKCGISWDTSELLGFAMISWYNPIFFWWSAPNSKDFMVAVPRGGLCCQHAVASPLETAEEVGQRCGEGSASGEATKQKLTPFFGVMSAEIWLLGFHRFCPLWNSIVWSVSYVIIWDKLISYYDVYVSTCQLSCAHHRSGFPNAQRVAWLLVVSSSDLGDGGSAECVCVLVHVGSCSKDSKTISQHIYPPVSSS